MNLKEIKELINLMNENGLMELEVEREGMKIRIRKSASGKFETITEEVGQPQVMRTVKEGVVQAGGKTPSADSKLEALESR